MTKPLQPFLHDSVVVLTAPSQAWSAPDGSMTGHGIEGFYHSDTRVLDLLELTIDGRAPEHIGTVEPTASTAVFTSLARNIDDETPDPRIELQRTRAMSARGMTETITLSNALPTPVTASVAIVTRAAFSSMHEAKSGIKDPAASFEARRTDDGIEFTRSALTARLSAPGADIDIDGGRVELRWRIEVAGRSELSVSWEIEAHDEASVVGPAEPSATWEAFDAASDDPRLAAWLRRAISDLQALRMTTSKAPGEVFLAAGAPWFFTLFGRDSLWAARMLLPLGTDEAASTLRVLAALQGTRVVAETSEEPGKIMHELRQSTWSIPDEDVTLPPLYYGTVDATALWILLLHDAWRAGMPGDEVSALIPSLEAALAWMRDFGDRDGDGFLEYVDSTGHGLANQGWKDSGDSIQWNDGRLAVGPVALCEVQGYAYEAALGGAALLDAFDRPGADTWRDWAEALKSRFTASFWIDDADGGYPAIALDADKKRVDTVTSNIGHLLGTGILTPEQSRSIARRLVSPELNSGYGVRTMSTDAAGYWPFSYHGGSVWAHDTAICMFGLFREGHLAEADVLAEGLLKAAHGFDYRMPELHAGIGTDRSMTPLPYPAACRPQAWSAASAVVTHAVRHAGDR